MVNNFSRISKKKQRQEKLKQLRLLILNNNDVSSELVPQSQQPKGKEKIGVKKPTQFSKKGFEVDNETTVINTGEKQNKGLQLNNEAHSENGSFYNKTLTIDESKNNSNNVEIEQSNITKLISVKVKTVMDSTNMFEVKVFDGYSPFVQETSLMSLSSYGINKIILKKLSKLKLASITDYQKNSMPALLEGRDLLAVAKTKLDRCLAYLIPAIEILLKLQFNARHGTGVIILFSTQELVFEYYGIIHEIAKCHQFTCSDIIGLNSKQYEENELRKGSNIIVATPGNLLYHLNNSNTFKYVNLQYLVVDGLSHMMKLGFSYELKQIQKLIPRQRQTVLLTAKLSEKLANFSKDCLKKFPFYVEKSTTSSVKVADKSPALYMVCPSDKRLLFLFSFLRVNQGKKIVILLSSCLSAQYHYNLFDYKDIPCCCIHGKQTIEQKASALSQFKKSKEMTVFCTNASSRELDHVAPDWVVQYDPPDDLDEFVEKRGRVVGSGSPATMALLMLRQKELPFVSYLQEAGLTLKEMKYPADAVLDIQNELHQAVKDMYFLHVSSRDGYSAFIRAYASHFLTSVFDVRQLDLVKEVLSFAFTVPPEVSFNVHCKQKGELIRKKKKKPRQVPVVFESTATTKKAKKF